MSEPSVEQKLREIERISVGGDPDDMEFALAEIRKLARQALASSGQKERWPDGSTEPKEAWACPECGSFQVVLGKKSASLTREEAKALCGEGNWETDAELAAWDRATRKVDAALASSGQEHMQTFNLAGRPLEASRQGERWPDGTTEPRRAVFCSECGKALNYCACVPDDFDPKQEPPVFAIEVVPANHPSPQAEKEKR